MQLKMIGKYCPIYFCKRKWACFKHSIFSPSSPKMSKNLRAKVTFLQFFGWNINFSLFMQNLLFPTRYFNWKIPLMPNLISSFYMYFKMFLHSYIGDNNFCILTIARFLVPYRFQVVHWNSVVKCEAAVHKFVSLNVPFLSEWYNRTFYEASP